MGIEFNLISRDAKIALQEFSEQFSLALMQGPVEQWSSDLGVKISSSALKTTFPIPVTAAGYKEFKGDLKYRQLFEKSIELVPKTWQDGVSVLASVIEAPDFIGWTTEPAAMAEAGNALENEIISQLIESNPVSWTGVSFFNDAHPINVFDLGMGTFDNNFTGAPSVANLALAKQYFRQLKAPNGKPLGLRMTHLMCAPAKEEAWRDILERNFQNEGGAAIDNRHKDSVQLIVNEQLSQDNPFYPLALNKPGSRPWVIQDAGGVEEIIQDKSDALYKTSLKVGVAYIKRSGGALILPHCMQKWSGV
jgi:phage major head subunit gpT-like protein